LAVRLLSELAVKNIEALANNEDRILLTLATGTGKTAIAFQIAWKLSNRWNLNEMEVADQEFCFGDRNILADQAFNSFSAFPDDALIKNQN
jgi:type I restriction enzyme R subunit